MPSGENHVFAVHVRRDFQLHVSFYCCTKIMSQRHNFGTSPAHNKSILRFCGAQAILLHIVASSSSVMRQDFLPTLCTLP